ncbi:hypothetical protein K0M31_002424 [Melipona bicolor]|uniref:Uncharacterized protein n=1 Tax=Melipona bicolor TaxID=60889 RepID=A0AA40GHU7_9HYME|nr:hypothetical protein K0M31_002424 [Melipona bicolor]
MSHYSRKAEQRQEDNSKKTNGLGKVDITSPFDNYTSEMVIDSLKIERVPWIRTELMSTRARLPWQLDFIDPTACLEFLSGQG